MNIVLNVQFLIPCYFKEVLSRVCVGLNKVSFGLSWLWTSGEVQPAVSGPSPSAPKVCSCSERPTRKHITDRAAWKQSPWMALVSACCGSGQKPLQTGTSTQGSRRCRHSCPAPWTQPRRRGREWELGPLGLPCSGWKGSTQSRSRPALSPSFSRKPQGRAIRPWRWS